MISTFSKPATVRASRTRTISVSARASSSHVAIALGALAALHLASAPLASAEVRLPPLDPDPRRCERGFVGNTIGQANGVSDKILDIRQCSFKGANLNAKVLSGALMSDADFTSAKMQEIIMTKAYAEKSDFSNADMTNGVLDRVDFRNANLSNAKLVNVVLTGATWDKANLEGVDFTDALIGSQDVTALCANPTLKGESRVQVGCRNQ